MKYRSKFLNLRTDGDECSSADIYRFTPGGSDRYWVGPRAGLEHSPLSENEGNFMCVSPHRLDTTPTELLCLLIVFEKR
jgi:hypothetical protein